MASMLRVKGDFQSVRPLQALTKSLGGFAKPACDIEQIRGRSNYARRWDGPRNRTEPVQETSFAPAECLLHLGNVNIGLLENALFAQHPCQTHMHCFRSEDA